MMKVIVNMNMDWFEKENFNYRAIVLSCLVIFSHIMSCFRSIAQLFLYN